MATIKTIYLLISKSIFMLLFFFKKKVLLERNPICNNN